MSRSRRRGRATGVTVELAGIAAWLTLAFLPPSTARAHSPTPPRPSPAADPAPDLTETPEVEAPEAEATHTEQGSAPLPSPPSTAAPPRPTDTRIEAALEEATQLRRTGRPGEAIPELTKLIETIEPEAVRRDPDVRAAVLLELAALHDALFDHDQDQDPQHLLEARALLDRLIAETEIHGYAAELVDQALAMRARVDDRLLLSRTTESSPNMPASSGPHGHRPSQGRGLRIAGWTLLGLGTGAAGVALAGVGMGLNVSRTIQGTTLPAQQSQRVDAIERGQLSNGLALGGSIAASTLLVAGVTTVVLGTIRRRRTPAHAGLGRPIAFLGAPR